MNNVLKTRKFPKGFYEEIYGNNQENVRICKDDNNGKKHILMDKAELMSVVDGKLLEVVDYDDTNISVGLYKVDEKNNKVKYLCGNGEKGNTDFEIGENYIVELGGYVKNDRMATLYSYDGENASKAWSGLESEIKQEKAIEAKLKISSLKSKNQPESKNTVKNIATGDIDKLLAMKTLKETVKR